MDHEEMRALIEATGDEDLVGLLYSAERDVHAKSEDLRKRSYDIERVGQRVREMLDGDMHVNRLGELQQIGRDFERLCSEREQAVDHRNSLRWLVEKKAGLR